MSKLGVAEAESCLCCLALRKMELSQSREQGKSLDFNCLEGGEYDE